MLAQTDCNTQDEAKAMFHGVIIKYHYRNQIKPRIIFKTDSASIRSYIAKVDSFVMKVDTFVKMAGGGIRMDSTVLKIFNRNHKWKNMLVVIDWTGSMYSYGSQIAIWNAMNLQRKDGIKNIVFFNDGSGKPDYKKKIGSTGGIYYCEAKDITSIYDMMFQVQRDGDGGDYPENDLEALLKSINKYKKTVDDIILIADNTSCMRDYDLLYRIHRPIHVLLCRTGCGINPQYLNLAFKTGGSIHTLEQDIQDVVQGTFGGKITVDGVPFKLAGNGFYKVSDEDYWRCPDDCDYKSNGHK